MPTPTPAGPEEDPGESSAEEGSAGLDEDVLEMVRRQLDRDPPPSTNALYGRAVRINSDIYDLSLRQFHAKYPLRVKREKARREREASARSQTSGQSGEGAGASAPDGEGGPAPEVDEDAGRRHLFGGDEARDAGGEDPRRTGAEAGGDGRRRGGARPGARDRGESPRAAAGPVDEATRERVRRVFMRFAREVAEAERPEMLVGVVERIPDRVDEIAGIVGPKPPEA